MQSYSMHHFSISLLSILLNRNLSLIDILFKNASSIKFEHVNWIFYIVYIFLFYYKCFNIN